MSNPRKASSPSASSNGHHSESKDASNGNGFSDSDDELFVCTASTPCSTPPKKRGRNTEFSKSASAASVTSGDVDNLNTPSSQKHSQHRSETPNTPVESPPEPSNSAKSHISERIEEILFSSFEQPCRSPPATPISNFTLTSVDFSSSEGSGEALSERDLEIPEESEAGESEAVGYVETMGEDIRSLFGSRGSIHSDVLRRRRQIFEGREDESDDQMKETVMSAVWANGKLGAAYYELETSEMFLLPDTAESAPDFMVLRSLFKQILPRFVVVSSRQDERMLKVMQELCGDQILDRNDTENLSPPVPSSGTENAQLYRIQGKDFAPEPCKQRMLSLKLPNESKNTTPEEHMLFITSLIPFTSEIMIRSAGGLLRFMDRSAIEVFQIELVNGHVPVLNIKTCTMDDIVMVDDTAWKSLQIFSVDIHPSAVKQANHSGSKEGLSIFSMLNHCSTVQGARSLRLMLLRPSRNIFTLNRRYQIIEFCSNTQNMEFVKSAKDCLKSIKSIPKLLYKLSLLHATVGEWKDLYNTIYHGLLLEEICGGQSPTTELFKEISSKENLDVLKTLSQEMMRVIDFDESIPQGRIVARQGIDAVLDSKKQQYSCLPEIMALVAREEMNGLPDHVAQCCVVYIPEVGYLLAITLWQQGLESQQLQIEGMEFKFSTSEMAYYKSPRTIELDTVLGDCSVSILEKETTIMIFLTECILGKSAQLLKIGSLISELDCLISMSTVARNNGFVRPEIVHGDQKMEIRQGRHPLVEMICDFVPNSTTFNSQEKITILTGPNASGKSIYLKQIGVITIMALSGSFVPADYARIPTYDRICTRIHTTESLSTGFSSFMTDLTQISMALTTSTKQSLVIVDEFGKGTAEADGLALLAASVENFIKRGGNSPTLFLSTHFYSLMKYLERTPLVKTQCMKFMRDQSGASDEITYLFELKNGTCNSSFASLVADSSGIPKRLLERSAMIEDVIRGHASEECIRPIILSEQRTRKDMMIQVAEQFLELDLEAIDPQNYLDSLKHLVD